MEPLEQQFKSETRTIAFLGQGLFFLLHLAIITELINDFALLTLIRLLFFFYFKNSFLKTIKQRYYTFWTFSFFLTLYLVYKMVSVEHLHILLLYAIAQLFLFIEMYILSSPIYYPRVSWWEYDFRYRDDLPISLKFGDEIEVARLTDLRRLAGCIALFRDVKLGEELTINSRVDDEEVSLKAIVMTRRRELVGRPIIYGVQFRFDNRSNKKRYIRLMKLWKKDKKNKKLLKLDRP